MSTATQMQRELTAEKSRANSLIVTAIMDLGAGRNVRDVETEPLEALYEFIGAELQDRSRREHPEYLQAVPF